jgi:predicted permease
MVSKDSAGDSAVLALTLTFPNIAAVGFPLLESMYGPQQDIVVVVGIAVGAITITAVTLAILESGTAEGRALSTMACIRDSVWKALKKPVFWAPMLGILTVIIGFHLPSYFDHSLTIFGSATAGSALFLTGLVVSAQRFEMTWGVTWAVFVKNILQPALCLGIARLLGLPLELTRSVVLMTAIPCGFFGIVFGKHFDVTPPVASSGLIASYVVGIFSLAGWIVVLTYLH